MRKLSSSQNRKWWVEPRVTAGFLIAWLLLSIVGGVAFWSAQRYGEISRSVVQTRDVLTNLEESISLLKDAETGQRGFLLSGAPEFLASYELAQRQLPGSLTRLRTLTDQQSRLDELEARSRAKLDDLAETLRLAQAGDNRAVLDRLRSGRGRQLMDAAQSVSAQMKQTEEIRLRQREAEVDNAASLVQLTIPIGFTLAALMLVLAGWQLNDDVRRRRLAEENLHKLNVGLDEQIRERTIQLENSLTASGQNADRLSRLQQITGAFAAASSPQQIADILLNQAIPTMQANDGVVYLMEPDGQTLGLVSSGASSLPALQTLQHIPITNPMVLCEVARTGKPYWIEKPEDYGNFTMSRQILEKIGSRGAFILPLMKKDKTIGVFRLSFTEYREFSAEEQAFALALAGQAAQALERAQLYAELEERAAELEIRVYDRTRQLEQASRYKTDFLSQMSHELRTPLNSIIGFTAIIRRGLAGPLLPEQEKQLDMVQGSAQQLMALISGLLDLSRIEAGRVSVEYSRFGLSELLQQSVESMRPLTAAKMLELEFEISQNLAGVQVRSDALKLKQILLNLLSNAVKYTDTGHITLRAEPVNGLPQNAGELFSLQICVEDSGIGIAARRLPLLFEEFGQLEEAGTRRAGGSGLGLVLTQRLVELLKGRIEVKSRPGQGTTFVIYLPLERA